MTKNKRPRRAAQPRNERRIIVRGIQREQPDLRKLSRAVIAMAQADAEREAQSQHEQGTAPAKRRRKEADNE